MARIEHESDGVWFELNNLKMGFDLVQLNSGLGAIATVVSTPASPGDGAGLMTKTTKLTIDILSIDDIRRRKSLLAVDDAITLHHRPILTVEIRLLRPSSWMAESLSSLPLQSPAR